MSKGVKNYMQLYGKTDHSGQRKGKNRNVTIFLIIYLIPFGAYFKPDVVLVKTCKLEHLFSEPS